ncbi:hypothetical protein GCM10023191_100250 [Actinoallomurus oryzae]|uniref:Uncharacterized protein n=1 Tax=Actinoallomurus oryzae TaxID=502180 RepID=A0ABP8R9V5_9ACTN
MRLPSGAPRDEPDYPPALGMVRAPTVGYLLRIPLSVQQVDLPIGPLNERIDLAKPPGEIIGLAAQLSHRQRGNHP